jgi:hypothetical protein
MKGVGEGKNFLQKIDTVLFEFKYFPVVWDLEEILLARTYLLTDTVQRTAEEATERFRQVGGVPGNIFLEKFSEQLQERDLAISALTKDQVIDIVCNRMDVMGTFADNQPRSAIIGYAARDNDATFGCRMAEYISPVVAENVYAKFIRHLWDQIGYSHVFETCCRWLMAGLAQYFQCRPCTGRDKIFIYHTYSEVALGGMVSDIVSAAREHRMVLFPID